MKRLYVFAIGGTGARVMRSLTMLMSAGELANHEVVPILVDFDVANGNLVQTHELMQMYKNIHDKSYDIGDPMHQYEGFFCSSLTPITSISNNKAVDNGSFVLDMPIQHHLMRVGELLDYARLAVDERPFRLLLDSLFTTKTFCEFNQDLCVGFKGSAKIARLGYAALKIQDTIEFKTLMQEVVQQRDKVVIVGSTFGATGSVGVLEILKQLKNSHQISIDNIATVLIEPYFVPTLEPAIGMADYRSVFMQRSQDFFKFYMESGLSDFVTATYRIGMDGFVVVDNANGGQMQRNVAHAVELLSAMAICEYAQTDRQGQYEYHLGKNNLRFGHEIIEENDFYQMPNGRRVFESLTRFILSAKFYKDYFCRNTKMSDFYFYREMQHRNTIERSYKDTLNRMFSDSLCWIEELSNHLNNKYELRVFDATSPLEKTVIGHPYSQDNGGFFGHIFRRDIVHDYIHNMHAYCHSNRQETRFNNMSSEQILVQLLSESSRSVFQQFKI